MGSETGKICRGKWHPAGNAASLDADLYAGEAFIAARDASQSTQHAWCGLDALDISQRVAGIPRRMVFPDGSTFETSDNDAIDAFLRSRGKRAGFLHALEHFHPRLIALTAGVILGAMAIYKFALPALVEVAVWVTPQAVPALMSTATLASMDRLAFDESTLPDDRKAALQRGFKQLAQAVEGSGASYNLNFRKGGAIGPNAFTLPDGTVVVTDELVKLTQDDEMLLGVLAHEIGHVERQHSLRQLYRAAGIYGLFMLVAGDIGTGMEDILSQGGGLLALSYSRDAESEADRFSVELMAQTGHDPAAIADFFEAMEKRLGGQGDASILSTHPGTKDRREAVEAYARELARQ